MDRGEPEPQAGTACGARLAGLVADALDLHVGAIEGEYCPGDYSLHAGGVKVGGISQRVTKSASATEGMVVVEDGERIREVLVAVNAALGVDWDPATAGDLAGMSLEDARDAFLARVARDHRSSPPSSTPTPSRWRAATPRATTRATAGPRSGCSALRRPEAVAEPGPSAPCRGPAVAQEA